MLLLLALGSAHTLLLGVGSEQKAEPDPAFRVGITCLSGCQLFCQVINSEIPAAAFAGSSVCENCGRLWSLLLALSCTQTKVTADCQL